MKWRMWNKQTKTMIKQGTEPWEIFRDGIRRSDIRLSRRLESLVVWRALRWLNRVVLDRWYGRVILRWDLEIEPGTDYHHFHTKTGWPVYPVDYL